MVSYPGNEEEVLWVMKQLEEKIRFREENKSKASQENPWFIIVLGYLLGWKSGLNHFCGYLKV